MFTTSRITRSLATAVAFAGLTVLAGAPHAVAGDAMVQTKTAAEHAQYAADSTALDMVRAHLHHTINCLVGPGGEGFDAGEANPCDGQGNGAIPDAADAAVKEDLAAALSVARSGLETDDVAAAQAAATQVAEMLTAGM